MIKSQELVKEYSGKGTLKRDKNNNWINKEFITIKKGDKIIKVDDIEYLKKYLPNLFYISYSKENGTHIVPVRRKDD